MLLNEEELSTVNAKRKKQKSPKIRSNRKDVHSCLVARGGFFLETLVRCLEHGSV